jgi:dTDP-4-dehydrorhamnose reductase
VSRPRILVTGAGGQLGWELVRAVAPLGEVLAPPRQELDLARPDQLRARMRRLRPAAVLNAAAYTAVDRAEAEPAAAFAVNAEGPGVLAEEAAACGALLVQFSTDYVFDGAAAGPYREGDPAAPLGVYGRSKLEGERAVAAAGGAHLVLRASWVYGTRGHNFLRTMLRLARERDELRVVCDQVGAPTWARMLAAATAAVLAQLRAGGGFALAPERGGVYHASAAGETSWHGFAAALLALDPARGEQRCRAVVPIPTAEFPTPAARPRNSLLSGERLLREFGVALPHWSEQLRLCMAELAGG